ncbi:MAG TPA: sulfite exporter TauE/SafE family protein [Frankiaceae bacterium]
MDVDFWVVVAGLIVGVVVGLTGMGGGALMTPILVLIFGVQPMSAVSSDLVAAAVMKPVGSGVHLRRGTVHRGLVGWLAAGSVPGAFGGVLLLRALGSGQSLQDLVSRLLGGALVMTVALLAYRVLRQARAAAPVEEGPTSDIPVRRLATLTVGVVGGLVVGLTSVGSGSLMVVALMALYPRLSPRQLVGTDLVQAVPLVFSAALAHVLFGSVQFGLTTSLIIGSVPGAYLGARISARSSSGLIRGALAVVLVASAAKLLGASTPLAGVLTAVALAGALGVGWYVRALGRRHAPAAPATAADPDAAAGDVPTPRLRERAAVPR